MKDQKTVGPIRDGFRTITPYLFAQNAARLLEFISKALGGEETYRKTRPDGAIIHAEMRVGDSMLMLGEATAQFGQMPTSIYLYVSDSDSVYGRALSVGVVSVFPVMTLKDVRRAEAVHEVRKDIKKVRSILKLARTD